MYFIHIFACHGSSNSQMWPKENITIPTWQPHRPRLLWNRAMPRNSVFFRGEIVSSWLRLKTKRWVLHPSLGYSQIKLNMSTCNQQFPMIPIQSHPNFHHQWRMVSATFLSEGWWMSAALGLPDQWPLIIHSESWEEHHPFGEESVPIANFSGRITL